MSARVLWQYLLPQHLLSRVVGWLANWRWVWFKNTVINLFILRYQVDMSVAQEPDPLKYENFNAFFTRALNSSARPIVEGDRTVACPVDGIISQMGNIEETRLLQAKNHYFDLNSLFGGYSEDAAPFHNGQFLTAYLAPKDYHRVHMPMTGKLTKMIYIPGRLFSVNTISAADIPQLFARNERVVTLFDTAHGPMALVLVGAMIVASIETVWAGIITPDRPRYIHTWNYDQKEIILKKGQEMGRFQIGSTVIMLTPSQTLTWAKSLRLEGAVVMGQLLGDLQ
jgi:phosphatidylserine decarboxylase